MRYNITTSLKTNHNHSWSIKVLCYYAIVQGVYDHYASKAPCTRDLFLWSSLVPVRCWRLLCCAKRRVASQNAVVLPLWSIRLDWSYRWKCFRSRDITRAPPAKCSLCLGVTWNSRHRHQKTDRVHRPVLNSRWSRIFVSFAFNRLLWASFWKWGFIDILAAHHGDWMNIPPPDKGMLAYVWKRRVLSQG